MTDYEDDPNAGLFGRDEPEDPIEDQAYTQVYEKNSKRVEVLSDLFFNDLNTNIEAMEEVPTEGKNKLLFSVTANSVLDLIADALPAELAIDVTYYLDVYMGLALVNKKYQSDLFKELEKALVDIPRSEFPDDETYDSTLEKAEEAWWDMPQPRLDKRTPNEAIREALSKYGLTE
ncbi:MAG: hypothetical protein LBM39_01485 [Candidatus Methanoplasma sp.]|jgi:hypothetical protein|nr:hypothetical protein [Candidatus Methanoplasma sp.]